MANHKVEVKSKCKNYKGEGWQSIQGWNINNIHDARAQIRSQVGIHSKKGNTFEVYHNEKLVYNSLNPLGNL